MARALLEAHRATGAEVVVVAIAQARSQFDAVSYTHLDVYKRQAPDSALLLGVVGALTAGAKMLVFNSKEFKDQKLFYQVVKHFKKVDFMASSSVENREDLVKKGMEKFSKCKTEKEDRILILTSDMRFINADKPIKQ